MSNQDNEQHSSNTPKKAWERSIVAFGLAVAAAAIAGAFGALSYVRSVVDQRVDDRLTIALPIELKSDPEIKFLSDQRKEILEARNEIAQFRSNMAAELLLAKERLEDALADAEAGEASTLQSARALQSKIRELDETINASRVLAQIDARAEDALAGLDERLVQRLDFPTDAIVAFAKARPEGAEANGPTDDPCPIGWKRYREADGRAIIGVGPDDNPFRQDGQRKHKLISAEIPQHTHTLSLANKSYRFDNYSGFKGAVEVPTGGTISPPLGDDSKAEPHNNMPPYIALYFCRKGG